MRSNTTSRWALSILGALWLVSTATANVIEFDDRDDWIDAVGSFETIGFAEFPSGTLIVDQYAHLGAHFTDGFDLSRCCNDELYLNDGAGLDGFGSIIVEILR